MNLRSRAEKPSVSSARFRSVDRDLPRAQELPSLQYGELRPFPNHLLQSAGHILRSHLLLDEGDQTSFVDTEESIRQVLDLRERS